MGKVFLAEGTPRAREARRNTLDSHTHTQYIHYLLRPRQSSSCLPPSVTQDAVLAPILSYRLAGQHFLHEPFALHCSSNPRKPSETSHGPLILRSVYTQNFPPASWDLRPRRQGEPLPAALDLMSCLECAFFHQPSLYRSVWNVNL